MIKKAGYFPLILTLIASVCHANSPFGLGQNMKKPGFDTPGKKEKKGPHKNKLALKPIPELKEGLQKAMDEQDYETATKYLDALRMVCTNTEELKNILMQMADLYFKRGEWAKAERAYQEFVMLYPGADNYEYAYAQAAHCGNKLTLEPDRDQSKTEELLKFCQEFIDTHKQSDYLNDIVRVATECREKLLASDINIFNFYFNKKDYKAAQKRLDTMSKEHLPQLPSAEPKTLELTIQLAQAQNNEQNLLDAQFKLVTRFPEDQITKNLIRQPEQIKLAWETKYQAIQLPAPTLTVAQADSIKEKPLNLKTIVEDPLKAVEKANVKVAQAATKSKTT